MWRTDRGHRPVVPHQVAVGHLHRVLVVGADVPDVALAVVVPIAPDEVVVLAGFLVVVAATRVQRRGNIVRVYCGLEKGGKVGFESCEIFRVFKN